MKKKKVKAIAMVSGGLDSTLAIEMMKQQGVEILGLNFSTGFCITDHKRRLKRKDIPLKKMRNESLRAAKDTQIPLEIIDLSQDYVDQVILRPQYGYGAGLNPCTDCRIYMLQKAKTIMEKENADFIFTGEVMGQRPKSQLKHQLKLVEKSSGLKGKLLRPLSAKYLEPTIAEIEGMIDRNQLESISGRSRKRQVELAEKYKLPEFPQPAGGCCSLPDPTYAGKLLDLIQYKKGFISQEDALLLKVGRHFRINSKTKIVVGRDEQENNFLRNFFTQTCQIHALDFQTPTTLLLGNINSKNIHLAARITIRYSDAPKNKITHYEYHFQNHTGTHKAKAMKDDQIHRLRIGPKPKGAEKIIRKIAQNKFKSTQ